MDSDSAEKPRRFRFKQFEVGDDRCSMKVGTDAVLLGAWAKPGNRTCMLDIGTGSGVIALMLAQHSSPEAKIDALEILESDVEQAKENVSRSPWPRKISVISGAVQEFDPGKQYDLIISNPPYFVNSLRPPAVKRAVARHTGSLSFEDLLSAVARLMLPNGVFLTILPTEEGNRFESLAGTFGLHVSRKLAFYSKAHRPQERWLLEFRTGPVKEVEVSQLILYGQGNEWSAAYRSLTADFYSRPA